MDNKIVIAIAIVAGVVGATLIMMLVMRMQDNMDRISNVTGEPSYESQVMHKCTKLQQYYYDMGANVDIKCDKLVDALVN